MQQLLEKRDVMFPVYTQSVQGIGGKIHAPDVKMLTRINNNGAEEYISVVNKDYRVVENAEVLEHYGDVLYKLGRTKEAKEYWKRALRAGKGGSEFLEKKVNDGVLYE